MHFAPQVSALATGASKVWGDACGSQQLRTVWNALNFDTTRSAS